MAELPIVKIVVYSRRFGADEIVLYTSMPSPFLAGVDDEPLSISFRASKDTGLQYVLDNFPSAPEVWTQDTEAGDGKQERIK